MAQVMVMMSDTIKKKVLARLKRIEGQVAAIRRMVDQDSYCVDTLVQIAAAQGALGQAGKVVLESHIQTCVANALASGDERDRAAKLDELMDVFSRYAHLKSR